MKIDKYKNRKVVVLSIIVVIILTFIIRLFYLQVITDKYKGFADDNAFLERTIYPSRGLIFDRNGELLVYNEPSYDVMMVMREVKGLDTLALCDILHITKDAFEKRIKDIKNKRLNPGYSSYTPQVLISQLSVEEYGELQEKLFKFPGLYIQPRTLRGYTYQNAANVLGYINEVPKRVVEENDYYKAGDYIGISGIEKQYEELLRGEKGLEILLRNARGRIVGKYADGAYDVKAKTGSDLHLTIDMTLQRYGEFLMKNKLGGIVAIEPTTGEILAAVSAPSYTPSMMVGRKRSENYPILNKDPNRPLLDRCLKGRYAPGSTFKTANALIFLQEKIIHPNTQFGCNMGYHAGKFKLGCHSHRSPLDLSESVQHSCNAYYCHAFRGLLDAPKYGHISTAFEVWKNHVVSLGFGYRLGVDMPSEDRGYIPNSKVYDKVYGKNRWKSLMLVSLSIGQGEVTATPIQIANLAATIANKGYWYTPHFLKSAESADTIFSFEKHIVGIEEQYFDPIIKGMEMAVNATDGGTARVARIDSIVVCGKTGTAQNPHGEDHSIFMAFAPKENPRIAIAVLVENAGFGATWAAPIASLMIEKYLKGEIAPERKFLETRIAEKVIMPKKK
ncbi:MAG: penicillin-binding protein 2 [Paludibacteraceae bacterium]|jgi:penicillin-binding protein 2|nr:penicillin-binding protein 2 [Paludibacteraceae bacterium]